MQRKDLALRVLSTAAIMSIVTSIAAPAFADIYYIGNGSIDVVTKTGTDGEYVDCLLYTSWSCRTSSSTPGRMKRARPT